MNHNLNNDKQKLILDFKIETTNGINKVGQIINKIIPAQYILNDSKFYKKKNFESLILSIKLNNLIKINLLSYVLKLNHI